MSYEFDSLARMSQLPLAVQEKGEIPDDTWLVIMGGTHGDEQDQARLIQRWQEDADYPRGVLPVVANKLAANLGKRSISARQLMAWYPGDFTEKPTPANHENNVAAGITWLSRQLPAGHLVIDRHDNSQGNRYGMVGERTTPAALAVAAIMGHTAVQMSRKAPFFKSVPRSVLVEEAVPEGAAERYYEQACGQLELIVRLGHTGLSEYYFAEKVETRLRFVETLGEVCLLDPRTQAPNQVVLGVLADLEQVEDSREWGDEITVPGVVREALGLPSNRRYYGTGAQYQNRSPRLDNRSLGLPDDRERRMAWGGILTDLAAPRFDEETGDLVFDAA